MIDVHRGAFEYDWRARFHLPLRAIGRSMSWGEAIRLAQILASDPSSRIGAALADLAHPIERADLTLRDLYDLKHMAVWAQGGGKGSRPKPYPRPWPDLRKSRPRPTVSPEVAIAALRAAGHTAALPERFKHLETENGGRSHG